MRESNQRIISSVIGLLSLAALSGCGQAKASASGSSDATHASAAGTQALPKPVRVSRSFFDGSVEGSLRLRGEASSSAVSWREEETSLDHPGCATFEQAGGLEL